VSNLRVYIIISSFYPLVGGAETQAMAQARTLRARGYESTVVTFRHKKSWLPYEEIDGVPVIRVAGNLLGGREKHSRLAQRLFYMLALIVMGWTLWRSRHKYDLIHLYQLSALTLPMSLVSFFAHKPLLVAVRSTGTGTVKGSHESAKLIAGPLDSDAEWLHVDGVAWVDGDLESLVRMGKPALHFAHSMLERINAKVIILSTRMKDYLAAHDFLVPNLQLIPNGVDTTRFHPLKMVSLPTRRLILSSAWQSCAMRKASM
jgi:glycosyltransferase involved in cell wall biosynthesis